MMGVNIGIPIVIGKFVVLIIWIPLLVKARIEKAVVKIAKAGIAKTTIAPSKTAITETTPISGTLAFRKPTGSAKSRTETATGQDADL